MYRRATLGDTPDYFHTPGNCPSIIRIASVSPGDARYQTAAAWCRTMPAYATAPIDYTPPVVVTPTPTPLPKPITPKPLSTGSDDAQLAAWLAGNLYDSIFRYTLPDGTQIGFTRNVNTYRASLNFAVFLVPVNILTTTDLIGWLPTAIPSTQLAAASPAPAAGGSPATTPTPTSPAPSAGPGPVPTPAPGAGPIATPDPLTPPLIGGGSLFTLDQVKAFIASPTGKLVAYAAGGILLLKMLNG